jgi:CubicO group peptidase (beta-lactamase class C family)
VIWVSDSGAHGAKGLEAEGLDRVGEIIGAAVVMAPNPSDPGHGVPGVVAAAGRGQTTLGTWVAGHADTTPDAVRPMRADTVFDLASLTKVVATTTLSLALADRGDLALDERAGHYLPAATWDVTLRQLLSHTSGLPPIGTFYETCSSREEVLRALFATPLEAPPGTRVAYSDLGFMTLAEVVTAVTGTPPDVLFRDLVAEPLGLADTCYRPLADGAPQAGCPRGGVSRNCAGAEMSADRFAATERRADGTPWTGIVHDENARVMGGVAGHAGLFGTVADLGRFAAWWAGPGDGDGPAAASLRREAESDQTAGLDGDRGLGWTRIGDRHDILGQAWSPAAVSHTGFTGTSIALDPVSGVWVVLLTNGVHFGRGRPAVRKLRRDIHAAVAAALL